MKLDAVLAVHWGFVTVEMLVVRKVFQMVVQLAGSKAGCLVERMDVWKAVKLVV